MRLCFSQSCLIYQHSLVVMLQKRDHSLLVVHVLTTPIFVTCLQTSYQINTLKTEQVLLLPGLQESSSDTLVSIINLRGIILVKLRSLAGSFEEFDLFCSRTGKGLFTGQLIVNFHKGTIGKIQVTKTLKSKELATSDSEALYYMLLVVLSL